MDSQSCLFYLQSLILLTFPNAVKTQRITCPNACDVGYTCAMVRHGRGAAAPDCITMQEAILLHQALNGGPSGPGTGIGAQQGQTGLHQPNVIPNFPQQQPNVIPNFPQQQPNVIPNFPQPTQLGNAIPGMNFLGGTVPEPQGFEQRFRQGLSIPTTNFVNPQDFRSQQGNLRMQGFGGSATGQFAAFGSPQGPPGLRNPGLLNPTAGQFDDPTGAFVGSQGFGFRQQVDGGHNHSPTHASGRPSSLSLSNNIENTNINPRDGRGGGRSGRPSNEGFPGEQLSPELSVGHQPNIEIHNANVNTMPDDFLGIGLPQAPEQIAPISQVTVDGTNNVTLTDRPERVSQVTQIMEDLYGLYYLFYPRPESGGLRVNITKSGFCRRDAMTRERNFCMNTCYSDQQCPRDLKCCPSGCSLGCITQSFSNQESNALPQVNSPRITDTAQAVESRCFPCQSHLDCNSQDQFCTMSDFCGQRMVCRLLVRR